MPAGLGNVCRGQSLALDWTAGRSIDGGQLNLPKAEMGKPLRSLIMGSREIGTGGRQNLGASSAETDAFPMR